MEDVDYDSDSMTAPSYESKREDHQSENDRRHKIKGRGAQTNGNENSREERYRGEAGVFQRVQDNQREAYQKNKPVKSVEGYIVIMTGVHEEAQEDDILDHVGEVAQVKNIHVNLDRRTGFVKGYALIEFADAKGAQAAIDEFDGQEYLGQKIHLDWAFRHDNQRSTGARGRRVMRQ